MKLFASIIAALGLAVALLGTASADEPRQFIQTTADQVLAILRDESLSSDQKISRIEQIAYEKFDFETISRLVLARNWRKLSPQQQEEFVREFKRHLSVTYGKNIENYRNETIDITGDRAEARGDWTVQTKVLRSGDDILVDYRLRKIDGEWNIIDVIIERVSFIANFRAQFQDIVASRGVDEMLRLLREKNASGESILPEENEASPASVGS